MSADIAEPPPVNAEVAASATGAEPPADAAANTAPPTQPLFQSQAEFDAAVAKATATAIEEREHARAQEAAAKERAATRPQHDVLRQHIHHNLGLSAVPDDDDSVAQGLLDEAADVLRKMEGWRYHLNSTDPARRAKAEQQLRDGERAWNRVRLAAMTHEHVRGQQKSAATSSAESSDPTAVRAQLLQDLASDEVLALVKQQFPGVHALLASNKLTMEGILGAVDCSQGYKQADTGLLREFHRLNNVAAISGGGQSQQATTAATGSPPANPGGSAPGEANGYSGGGDGQILSTRDYYARVRQRIAARKPN